MEGTIAITDKGWYEFLAARPDLHEVNFWRPSPRSRFKAEPFSPFLFKLKAPANAICGFAYFAKWTVLPDWLAWDCFREGNGSESFIEMRNRIGEIRKRIGYQTDGHLSEIGCILLTHPVFFAPSNWIPQPKDWPPPTQTSMKYDLTVGEGERVWEECLARVPSPRMFIHATTQPEDARYGSPQLVTPRLGQGTFRVAVTDAYDRACAVTDEHSLPALDAAHIKPYAQNGPHDVRNGLLLRADLHRLFDSGYLTVTPKFRLEVSERLRQDYHNGRSYYPLHGTEIRKPIGPDMLPQADFLRWHNENVFMSR